MRGDIDSVAAVNSLPWRWIVQQTSSVVRARNNREEELAKEPDSWHTITDFNTSFGEERSFTTWKALAVRNSGMVAAICRRNQGYDLEAIFTGSC